MVRLLARFGLSHPCSAPMQIVAHTNMHTFVVLAGLRRITSRYGNGHWKVPEITADQNALCEKLCAQYVDPLAPYNSWSGRSHSVWGYQEDLRMPAKLRGTASGFAKASVPELRAAFGSFKHFLQQARCTHI